MKRTFSGLMTVAAGVLLGLALPGSAVATITEIGHTDPAPQPTCPTNPCLAVSRTTGFQTKAGTTKSPFLVPKDGRIVAWTVTLGKPADKQISFFNNNEGGPASAEIAVLRPGKHLFFRLVAESPPVQLQPYFGTTAQFPLAQTLPVKKGELVALTVPTWAPALAVGFDNNTSWRASRNKKRCSNTTDQTALMRPSQDVQFACLYRTARLTFSATLISTP